MAQEIRINSREELHHWFEMNHDSTEGFWFVFKKDRSHKTLTHQEALEEALCYGWIDGVMKKINEIEYMVYFAQRRKDSQWSNRNKAFVAELEAQGRLTSWGRQKIDEAKRNGKWDTPLIFPIDETEREKFLDSLRIHELAYTNYCKMSESIQKTYLRFYLDAKSEETRSRRLIKVVNRLNQNLKPM